MAAFLGGHARGQDFRATERGITPLVTNSGDGVEVDEVLRQCPGIDHRLGES